MLSIFVFNVRLINKMLNRKHLEKMGFTFEVLSSGKINICNKIPFIIDGIQTIIVYRGFYVRTTYYNSIEELLSKADIRLVE